MTETTKPICKSITTIVELLGKPYQIKCDESEAPALQKAAEYLNKTLLSLPYSSKTLATEKVGMMAALNLASRLIELETQMNQQMALFQQKLGQLHIKLENALYNASTREELEPAAQI